MALNSLDSAIIERMRLAVVVWRVSDDDAELLTCRLRHAVRLSAR